MNNKPLKYLLNNDPKKVISKHGIIIRKLLNPIFQYIVIPLSSKNKLVIERKAKIPKDKRVIFALTHGFRDDLAFSMKTIGKQAYILWGSLPAFYESFDGWAVWINGTIMVDRKNKESRAAARPKMEYAISLGSDLVIYPEGVWNKTENLIVQRLFPGIYDVAKSTGAVIMPLGIIQEGNMVYSILDEPFDITQYIRQEGLIVLRDKMATLKYELMEKHSVDKRENIGNAKEYWDRFLNDLIATAHGHYDYEIENTAHFVDKNIVEYSEVFGHLDSISPAINNAFLFSKRNHN